ncbi:MAG TPA: hypothetical protein VH877_26575, partial [Polyangia bacterium]|nr:hypothetical protein [Polyangia bacterium]
KLAPVGDAPLEVAAGLEALAALVDGWEKRGDEVLEVLLAAQNLTGDDVARARATALRLRRAYEGTRGERVEVRDPPAVNRIEGRVLLEMRTARRAFDAARAKNKLVARLVPGRGTRGVLGSRAMKEAEEEPPKGDGGPSQGQGDGPKGTKGASGARRSGSPATRAKARRGRRSPRRR